MSMKQDIETWVSALNHYDNHEFEYALRVFDKIADTSKILFNCGVIHATIGEHDRAIECYQRATSLDQYLAVAYFQEGVSNFLVGDFEEALANFNDTLLYLRGNQYIDYDQLGLKFKLYSCEVLFNRGLCYIYLQQEKAGMQDFSYAVKEKMTPDHDVIDDAMREMAVGYTVFSIPVGVLYRPNEAKVKNLKTKDYLGKARLIATATSNTSTGFTGAERQQQRILESSARDDRPPEQISYAATNLVQKGLTSRGGRDQSAPPAMGRNPFPPTPPPDSEKSGRPSQTSIGPVPLIASRSASVRSAGTSAGHRAATSVSQPATRQLPFRSHSYNTPQQLQQPTPPMSDHSMPSSSSSEQLGLPNLRTASEPRGPPSRQAVPRVQPPVVGARTSGSLFGEQPKTTPAYSPGGDNVDEVYSRYSGISAHSVDKPKKKHRSKARQDYLDEEDEYINSSPDEAASQAGHNIPSHSRGPSTSSSSLRRPQMRKMRAKVHANDDTRYIMINEPHVQYDDFESRVREKFNIRGKMRMLMPDFDDEASKHMITMADQDDLDVLLSHVREVARKEKNEMGKLEVWVQELRG